MKKKNAPQVITETIEVGVPWNAVFVLIVLGIVASALISRSIYTDQEHLFWHDSQFEILTDGAYFKAIDPSSEQCCHGLSEEDTKNQVAQIVERHNNRVSNDYWKPREWKPLNAHTRKAKDIVVKTIPCNDTHVKDYGKSFVYMDGVVVTNFTYTYPQLNK